MLSDVTLRDGMHFFGHVVSLDFVREYAQFAEKAGISVLEVGHGVSLGCENPKLNIDQSVMICEARKFLNKTMLSTHINPDFCTVEYARTMVSACAIDIARIACVPEDIAKTPPFLGLGLKETWISLMYSSTMDDDQLAACVAQLGRYGFDTIVLFDSAGNYLPESVSRRFSKCRAAAPGVRLGFHGHNNLQMAVANSLASGADIIDASLHGIGAGSGNAPLEILMNMTVNDIDKDVVYSFGDAINLWPVRKSIQVKNAIKNISPLHVNDLG
jgi:4-hydroxy 2-oxovalerate aldolase